MTTAVADFVRNDPRLVFDAETHTYRLGDRLLPSVTQVLERTGVADFTAPWFDADIKDRGARIHQAIQLDNEDDLDEDTLDDDLRPYLDGWRTYKRDTGCRLLFWEERLCDPLLGYAGTLDGIVAIPEGRRERLVLIDIKRALYRSAGPQLAAYRECAQWLFDVNRPAAYLHRAVVELPGDGTYRVHPLTDDNDKHVFLSALRIHNWKARA